MQKRQKNKFQKTCPQPPLRKRFRRGFSMMEVVISMGVLTIGILGVAELMVKSIRHAADSRDQIIASQLAQEGIELVRNIRDNNLAKSTLDPTQVFDGLPAATNYNCRMDYNDPAPLTCSLSADPANYTLHRVGNFYAHAGSTPTKFARRIQVISDGTNKRIVSIVSWKNEYKAPNSTCNVGTKCIYVEDVLTNRK